VRRFAKPWKIVKNIIKSFPLLLSVNSFPEVLFLEHKVCEENSADTARGPFCLGERVRRDFPVFADPKLVYLDSAASAQKPDAVLRTMDEFYRTSYANIHRGVYPLSVQATQSYDDARRVVAQFLGASAPEEIVFTRSATEAANLAAHSWGRKFVGEGDEILVTLLEHHSNFVPWQMLAQEKRAGLKVVGLRDDLTLDVDDFVRKLSARTKLFCVTHLANALGWGPPVAELIELAHAQGAKVLIDGAQSVAHAPVNVRSFDADFFIFSGHKLYGPTGIGALYARREILEEMPPFMGGGDMIRSVSIKGTMYADVPQRFEAGTPHISGAIGLAAAIEYVSALGMENIAAHEEKLVRLLERRLAKIPQVKPLGPEGAHRGLVCFTFDNVHPHDLAQFLSDKFNVAVRAGHHCNQPLLEHLRIPATTRASLGVYNTADDIEVLGEALEAAARFFKF